MYVGVVFLCKLSSQKDIKIYETAHGSKYLYVTVNNFFLLFKTNMYDIMFYDFIKKKKFYYFSSLMMYIKNNTSIYQL